MENTVHIEKKEKDIFDNEIEWYEIKRSLSKIKYQNEQYEKGNTVYLKQSNQLNYLS